MKQAVSKIWAALLSWASLRLNRSAAALCPESWANQAILDIAKRRPETLKKFVLEKASEVATQIVIASWDREGLRHCAACPERFGLRQYDQHWLCADHYKEVAAKVAVPA